MINLIPPDARRAVTREYWIRVVTVWLWLFACTLLMIATLSLPTYVLVESQLSVFTEEFNAAQLTQDEFERSEELITSANTLATHLRPGSTPTNASTYLDALNELAVNGVRLNRFGFDFTDTTITEIEVAGVATNRAALTSFSDSIEATDLFLEAEIPISNLASDRDISFNITVTTNPENS